MVECMLPLEALYKPLIYLDPWINHITNLIKYAQSVINFVSLKWGRCQHFLYQPFGVPTLRSLKDSLHKRALYLGSVVSPKHVIKGKSSAQPVFKMESLLLLKKISIKTPLRSLVSAEGGHACAARYRSHIEHLKWGYSPN